MLAPFGAVVDATNDRWANGKRNGTPLIILHPPASCGGMCTRARSGKLWVVIIIKFVENRNPYLVLAGPGRCRQAGVHLVLSALVPEGHVIRAER